MMFNSVLHSYAADEEMKGYIIHGATVTEVEFDVLTGEKLVNFTLRAM